MAVTIGGTTGITIPATATNQSGSVAWCNFGYVSSAITVRASYNVTSVTRASAGLYTVNFTNALADANYCVLTTGTENTTGEIARVACIYGDASTGASGKTSNAVKVVFGATNAATFFDSAEMNVAVFR